jgi:hypothetical protein
MSLFKLFVYSFVFFFAVLALLSLGAQDVTRTDLTPLLGLGVFAALQSVVLIGLERLARGRETHGRRLAQAH